jgi:hypothetical protein
MTTVEKAGLMLFIIGVVFLGVSLLLINSSPQDSGNGTIIVIAFVASASGTLLFLLGGNIDE